MNRLTYVIVALLVATGCGSRSATPGSANANQELDDASALNKAKAAVDAPGTRVAEVSSSLSGVTTWTAYLSDGVTVLGSDASGRLKAATVFELDAEGVPQAFVCAVAEDLQRRCADVMTAIANDLRGTTPPGSGAITGQTIRPLAEPGGDDASCGLCKKQLGGFFDKYNHDLPADLDPTPQANCVLTLFPSQCTVFHAGVGSRTGMDWIRGIGPEGTAGVAQACCGVPLVASNEGPGSSIIATLDEPVQLIVGGRQTRLLCRDSDPVCQ
jgi:hypothetical protein